MGRYCLLNDLSRANRAILVIHGRDSILYSSDTDLEYTASMRAILSRSGSFVAPRALYAS